MGPEPPGQATEAPSGVGVVCYKCRVHPAPVAFHRPLVGPAERAAADAVLASGDLVQGEQVEQLEAELSVTVGRRHCVAVASGTAALHLGLVASGVGPGDEVIVPSFTFAATAHAVVHCGATPVFVDIEPQTFCMDPASLEAALTERTAAVIPVHLYGHPAPMEAISEIARRAGILVVEDACQAQGAQLGGRPVGTLGDLAAISFYPSKTMTTIEGGVVVCEDDQTAATIRSLRNQGLADGTRTQRLVGWNARMTDVAAAIGRVQLARVDDFLAARRANARRWDQALPASLVPTRDPQVDHAFSQYTISVPDRTAAQAHLAACGIPTRIYYETPLHLALPYRAAPPLQLPRCEEASRSVLSLPVGPHLTDDDRARVVAALAGL